MDTSRYQVLSIQGRRHAIAACKLFASKELHMKSSASYLSPAIRVAAAIGMQAGEQVQWELLSRDELHPVRCSPKALAKERKGDKSSLSPLAE